MPDQSTFAVRHIGPDNQAIAAMLDVIGVASLDELAAKAVPTGILDKLTDSGAAPGLDRLPPAATETEALAELRALADTNTVAVSMIGQGYYDTLTPPVLLRNIMENPAWYTAYTPYQPEISQGRLEALLNFQTMVTDLTGLEIANASMLDEGHRGRRGNDVDAPGRSRTGEPARRRHRRLRRDRGRADHPRGATGHRDRDRRPTRRLAGRRFLRRDRPAARGQRPDHRLDGAGGTEAHERGALVAIGADLLACTLITPPGEHRRGRRIRHHAKDSVCQWDSAVRTPGTWPCTAKQARQLPGRLVGVSVDSDGAPAYRLALQTREQHIRRDKATSNICTAQVLLAVLAAMYASYHGADGLTAIARRVHAHAEAIAAALGDAVVYDNYFDTVLAHVPGRADEVLAVAKAHGHQPVAGGRRPRVGGVRRGHHRRARRGRPRRLRSGWPPNRSAPRSPPAHRSSSPIPPSPSTTPRRR